jgi:hypothetical protein
VVENGEDTFRGGEAVEQGMARDVGELDHVPELRFLQDGVPVGG